MKKQLLHLFIILLITLNVQAQDESIVSFELDEAILVAQQQSPDAIVARHNFRSQYWNYCYYKANYLPSLVFSSAPNFNHSINAVTMPDGTSDFVQQNQLVTDGTLMLSQNIALTGGRFFVRSALERLDILGNDYTSYKTTPVVIGYEQALLGYNSLKWDRKIEPLRFEEAKRSYVETMVVVASRTISRFFNLAMAQANLQIAQTNYANADTLYLLAQGRYDIGTITENEMLQLEINRLTEESNMLNARIELENCMQELRTYLGISDQSQIEVKIDGAVPPLVLEPTSVLQLALNNSPDILAMKRRLLESESNVSRAKASQGFNLNLYAQLGLTQTATELDQAYKKPLNQQYVELGVRIPILDWGRGKGTVRVAQSNRDMTRTQVEQERTNFEYDIVKMVKQFNIQHGKVTIAAKTDRTAERRGDVARRLYILGKSTILELNASIVEKDSAKRGYINALFNYWSLYYNLRAFTLYDFEKDIPLTEDYNRLVKMLLNE